MKKALIVGLLLVTGIAHAQLITAGSNKLMLFGGRNHDVYLGCLSCNNLDAESIFNQFGKFGNSFSSTSVLNSFSPYGDKFSDTSMCNPLASKPPVVVDQKGGFYGVISKNALAQGRIELPAVLRWLAVTCK